MRKEAKGLRGDDHPKETKYLRRDSSQKARRHRRFSLAMQIRVWFFLSSCHWALPRAYPVTAALDSHSTPDFLWQGQDLNGPQGRSRVSGKFLFGYTSES